MPLTITSLYAGLLGVFFILLAYTVITHRHRSRVGLGVGDDVELERAVRIHANFSEYVPFMLLLLGLIEVGGAPMWVVHGLGATTVLARVLHFVGLRSSSSRSVGRWWGTALTFTLIVGMALGNVWIFMGA